MIAVDYNIHGHCFSVNCRSGSSIVLGGTDLETEGTWRWDDGTSFTWSNWKPGKIQSVIIFRVKKTKKQEAFRERRHLHVCDL